MSVKEKVEHLTLPILETENMELVDLEYLKEGPNWFLRLYIDHADRPINLDDCGRLSEKIGKVLDESDPIPHPYILEVSSPGAERPLKKESDYQKAIGKYVMIKTFEMIDGKKMFSGRLMESTADWLSLDDDGKSYRIPRNKVAKARLSVVL